MDREEACRILGLAVSATTAEVEKRWKHEALLRHPDKTINLPEGDRLMAEEELKRINAAHDFLKDPKNKHQSGPPKLRVSPQHIRFKDVDPGHSKATTIKIESVGGPYSRFWMDDSPAAWLKVIEVKSTTNDPLPLEATIEATNNGGLGGQTTCNLLIRLEDEKAMTKDEVAVKVELFELQTKSRPSTSRPTTGSPGAGTQSAPSSTPQSASRPPRGRPQGTPSRPTTKGHSGLPVWARWIIGIGIAAIVLVFVLPSIIMERLSQPLAMDNIYLWIAVVVGLVILWFTAGRQDRRYFWTTFALLMAFMVLSTTLALGWGVLTVVVALLLILSLRRRKQRSDMQSWDYVHRGQYLSQPTQLLNQRLVIINRDKLELEEKIKLYSMARPSVRYGDYDIEYDEMQSKISNLVSKLEDLERQERDIQRVLSQRSVNKT